MVASSILVVNRMVLAEGNRKYRVVFIDALTRKTWLIDIDDDDWAFPRDSRQLKAEIDSGTVKVTEDPYGNPPRFEEKHRKSLAVQTKRYELLKPFLSDLTKLLTKRERTFLISTVPTTRQTATLLLKQYLKRGMTQDALRPGYWKCGRPKDNSFTTTYCTVRRNLGPGAKKVGPPRTIATGTGINVNEQVRKHLLIGADLWLSSKGVTLQAATDFVVETYYTRIQIDPTTGKELCLAETDLKPSVNQLHYFIKTHFPQEYIHRKRSGRQHYDLSERAVLGWADNAVQGPGDEFQIDASVANVPLVSQFDRKRIVGYPVLYFVVDVFSRMITGVSVGFEGPSWTGAMMVLINMVTSKVDFCKKYGVVITEEEWPSHHACKRLLADRAELLSVFLGDEIIRFLGIDILNVTARRPDLKSLVERRFGIIETEFGAFAPGFVKQKSYDARRDFRLNATLNLFQFTQLLIRAILIHNQTPIESYHAPPEMITEGLPPAPLDLWNWGIENRSGCLNQLSVEKTMRHVMHRDKARVTAKGIRYHGIYYSSRTSLKEGWFERARRSEWDVTIGIEPSNLEVILLLDENLPRGFELCELIPSSIEYKFKSLYEVEENELANKQNIAKAKNDRQSERITHERAMRKILQTAKKEKHQLDRHDKRSATEKTRHTREARKLEKVALAKQNSIFAALGIHDGTAPAPIEDTPLPSPYHDELAARLSKEKEHRNNGQK